MSKMVQIRNMPDEMYRTLKSRAELARMSLSDYLLSELERTVARPTRQELLERLQSREPVELSECIVDALRAKRDTL